MINKQFGKKLQMLRKSRNVGISQAAKMLDITVTDYQALEQGQYVVRLDMLGRIAKAFNLSVAELMKGVEEL